jgi:hypothetical protein
MMRSEAYAVDGMNIARFQAWSVVWLYWLVCDVSRRTDLSRQRIGPIFKGKAALGTYNSGNGGKSSVDTHMHKYFPLPFC